MMHKENSSEYTLNLCQLASPVLLLSRRNRGCFDCSDRSLEYSQELLNSRVFPLSQLALPAKQARVKFRGEKSVLKTFDHPIDDGDHHLNIEIIAKFASFEPKANEFNSAIRIFGDEEAVDFALED